MTGAPKLQALVEDIARRCRNDAAVNLLIDLSRERDAAFSTIWRSGEIAAGAEVAKLHLRVLHHLNEIERIVDLIERNREGSFPYRR
jgi:hypothetical protein